jgi:hypothetical protein
MSDLNMFFTVSGEGASSPDMVLKVPTFASILAVFR